MLQPPERAANLVRELLYKALELVFSRFFGA